MSFVPKYPDKFSIYTNCNSIYKFIRNKKNKNIYKVISFIKQNNSNQYVKTIKFYSINNLSNILKIARKSQY